MHISPWNAEQERRRAAHATSAGDLANVRIHLIGIGGSAMGTLAALLKGRGATVQGSDEQVYPPMSEFLAREGIPILAGYRAEHIDASFDLVVVGNAISRGNPELEAVLDLKIRYASLPEVVRDQFLWRARSIVIAGTHGKTTTTALAGWLLLEGGADPTMFVGGMARNLGPDGSSYRLGRPGGPFVIEGDEYDSAYFDKTAKFLKYVPEVAVVNNLEFDHADIYPDMEGLRTAFRRFLNLVPRGGLTIVGIDSGEAAALTGGVRSRVQTFGVHTDADWRAIDIEAIADGTSFTLLQRGVEEGRVRLPLAGVHNVRNALAAIAVGLEQGVPLPRLTAALATFRGVKRRLEQVGVARGVRVFDDFAHHPTAVAETIAAMAAAHPTARLWVIFEPRSASSCRRIFQADFARAFLGADRVIVASVYRSTLPDSERLSEAELVADLTRAGVDARHLPSVDDIVTTVAQEAAPGDQVVIMSNGGFGGIHQRLLQAL
jgi:UDP-N-acetylmuramate: L-alanyl-gamma-D-glutamyl-meso-diaminopimelate ligase